MQIKQKEKEVFDGKKLRVGIVAAHFNQDITEKLLESTQATLVKYSVTDKNTTIISVPGSVEIPYALQALAKTKKYDCLVALGCVIQGDTPHFTYVCKMVQEGVLRVMLDYHIPIGFGVITANTKAQAEARTNSGAGATIAALELTRIKI